MENNQTKWNFYTSDPETWQAMIQACEEARESIVLEQFIFTADEIGNKFIEVCSRKAQQGIKVRFMWDAAGSFTFSGSSIMEDLRKKGIDLIFFKTLLPNFFNIHNYKSWYFRNHRRTLVVDGKVGFTGSICISKRMENWRDTNVRIEGLVVNDMLTSFERMWKRAQGKRISRFPAFVKSDYEFEYISNNPLPRYRYLYKRVTAAIRNSKKYVYITTPYFVPTHRLARILRLAAHRGVDVRIIIPKQSDFPIVDLGARTFFHGLLKDGVKIYLYKDRMIHSKTIVIDDEWSSIGTMNMDNISLLYNFEANLVTSNKNFTHDLYSHFLADLQNCQEITLGEWNKRFFIEKIATFFIKIFREFL